MKKKLTDIEIEELKSIFDNLFELPYKEAQVRVRKVSKILADWDLSTQTALRISLLLKLGEYHGRNGNPEESSEYYAELKSIAEELKDTDLMKRASANLAITMAQRDLYREAIDIWHELLVGETNIQRKLNLLNNLCVAYGTIGESHEALKYAYLALDLAEDNDIPEEKISPLLNIGAVYDRMLEPEKALRYWLESLGLSIRVKNRRREYEAMGNISLAYTKLKDYDKALEYAFAGLAKREKILPLERLGLSYNNIGHIYECAGNYTEALKYYQKGEDCYQDQAKNASLAHCMLNQASLFLKIGEIDKSLQKLDEVSTIENALTAVQNRSHIVKLYSEVYTEMQDYEKALHYSREYAKILSEELEQKRKNTISIKEAEFYRNKIEKQAVMYLAQNKELKRKNRQIGKSTRELKKINASLSENLDVLKWVISVISHDIRGPLSNFSKMLEMMQQNHFSAEEQPELLESLKNSSNCMIKLINEMLDGLRLQRQRMEFVTAHEIQNIVPILKQVLEIYEPMAMRKEVNLQLKTESDKVLARADSDLLKILLRNILNNSMKFTPGGGSVTLEAFNQEGNAILILKDSGIGMDKHTLETLQAGKNLLASGMDGATGLGMILCRDSVKRMRGKMKVESESGRGTTITITLPVE
jgi:signal transduction histidine kinase